MRKNKSQQTKSRMEKFADAIEMPKDVISNCSKITTYNDNQAIVENYKGILGYTENKIISVLYDLYFSSLYKICIIKHNIWQGIVSGINEL